MESKKSTALPDKKRLRNGGNKRSCMAASAARKHSRCKMEVVVTQEKKNEENSLKMCDSHDTISGGNGHQNELWELHLTDNSAMVGTPKQQEGNQAEQMSQATKLEVPKGEPGRWVSEV